MLRRADAAGRPSLTVYPDASLLISAFSTEVSSKIARAWLVSTPLGTLVASKWCETELASGFAIKVRRGDTSSAAADLAVADALRMLREGATFLPVKSSHFDFATDLIRRSPKPLRGGDALHLAVAQAAGATLWTLDRRMAEAGQALGLAIRLLV